MGMKKLLLTKEITVHGTEQNDKHKIKMNAPLLKINLH